MASKKFYGYYIKGNKIALIEKDVSTSGSDLNAEDYGKYKSPKDSVTDGLELEYTYVPHYTVTDASDTRSITSYTENGGLLKITMTAIASFTIGDIILITDSNKWNGLHEVNATTSNSADLVLKTKYNGGTVTGVTSTLTYNIDLMQDESFELDLPPYLCKAVVYYLKAKDAEFKGEIDLFRYNITEFKRMMEKHKSAKEFGPKLIQGFWGMR